MIPEANHKHLEPFYELLERISHRPVRWPAVMSRGIAAEYCSLAVSGFDQWVREGRLPPPLPASKRWSKGAIDRAIAKMDGGSCLSEEHDEAMLLDKWLSERHV